MSELATNCLYSIDQKLPCWAPVTEFRISEADCGQINNIDNQLSPTLSLALPAKISDLANLTMRATF